MSFKFAVYLTGKGIVMPCVVCCKNRPVMISTHREREKQLAEELLQGCLDIGLTYWTKPQTGYGGVWGVGSLLFQVGRVAAVDLLDVPVQLGAPLAQALPDRPARVLQVLGNMGSIPPGAGIHHGSVAVPLLWKPKQHLLRVSDNTESQSRIFSVSSILHVT